MARKFIVYHCEPGRAGLRRDAYDRSADALLRLGCLGREGFRAWIVRVNPDGTRETLLRAGFARR